MKLLDNKAAMLTCIYVDVYRGYVDMHTRRQDIDSNWAVKLLQITCVQDMWTHGVDHIGFADTAIVDTI